MEDNQDLNDQEEDVATEEPAVSNVFKEKQKSLTRVAKEVLAGEWGRSVERRKKLSDAGFDPNEVQQEVIRILNDKDSG